MNFPRLISFERALEILQHTPLKPLGTQILPFRECLGRILAKDIIASENLPAVPTAAMDGYAIAYSDIDLLRQEGLELLDSNKAGNPTRPKLPRGKAIKTFTGSQMPLNSDSLVIVENVEIKDNYMFLRDNNIAIKKSQWVRQVGDNYKKGDILLRAGEKIGAFEIGLLAELNVNFVKVYQRAKIGIICIGDEIIEVGETPSHSNFVRSVNAHLLSSLITQMGQEAIVYPLLKDDKTSIKAHYQQALEACDMVLTSGGMSMGDYDYTQEVMEELTDIQFKGVRLKPGKPVAFGIYPKIHKNPREKSHKIQLDSIDSESAESTDSKDFAAQNIHRAFAFGLPGFPNSCGVTFLLFGAVILARLQGREFVLKTLRATLKESLKRVDSRKEFRACEVSFENGEIFVSFSAKKSLQSSMINNLTRNTALAILEENGGDLNAGECVQMVLLSDLVHF